MFLARLATALILALTGMVPAQTLLFPIAPGGPVVPGGDVDGDGIPDIVVGHALHSGANGALLASYPPHRILGVGDADGGGLGDLVFWNPGIAEIVAVASENGQTIWAATEASLLNDFLFAIDDATGDGVRDLVQARTDSVLVRSGADGTILWLLPTTGILTGLRDMGDVNGNGTPDVSVSLVYGSTSSGVYDGATGALIAATDAGLPIGDANGDGFDDSFRFTTATAFPYGVERELLLGPQLLPSGPPVATPRVMERTQPVGDWDGDGIDELAYLASPSGLLYLASGPTERNGFDPAGIGLTGLGATMVRVGDLDFDGRSELALGSGWGPPILPALIFRSRAPVGGVSYPAGACTFPFASTIFFDDGIPILGRVNRIRGFGVPFQQTGSLFASAIPANPIALPGGCTPVIDVFGLVSLGPVSWQLLYPGWRVDVAIPAEPALMGAGFALQAIFYGAAYPNGFDVSEPINAVFDGWF